MIRYFLFVVLLVTFVFVLGSPHFNNLLPKQILNVPNFTNSNEQSSELMKLQSHDAFNALLKGYDKNQQYEYPSLVKTGTVTATTLNIRTHPNTNWDSAILATATEGEKLDILGEQSTWYQVSYQGIVGFVSKGYIAPELTLITGNHSTLQFVLIDSNTIHLSADVPFDATLTNHGTGKYTIHFDTLLFANTSFDLDHPDIPLFRTFSNQIEIYTYEWIHSDLTKQSDAMHTLTFTPTIYDVSLVSTEDREQLLFTTSGNPTYSFEMDGNRLLVTFAPEVEIDVDGEGILIDSLHFNYNQQEILVETSEASTWKVFSDSNSITIDISKRGIDGKRIVIDPGHGGSEKGTYGRQSGILEKDFNLDVAILLKKSLEDQGAYVHMTRLDDTNVYEGENYETFLDLMQRVSFTKELEADFFISIHADNFPADLSVNGTAGYYYGEQPHSFQSEDAAERIGSQVSEAIETKWLGVHDRSFVVLRHNPFPSILLELGFLSNRRDETKLIDPEYQQKMATAITQALVDYYQ